ncbi:MAG: aminotransferase class I/II-fold pyridoxal phosphate-dependent enzyme, partial [Clostridia bacterium]|nr:aminotransferase class I/II-fold pyridoxal phosphate-dependent enzyme [Clostridia bacterium]
IIFDNVYNRFITNGVKSIYEIEGAKKCAIEMRSFSKHLSFTGIRCSYYVVPNELNENVNKFWRYRTINRFNGASYIAQVGALASFDEEAKKDIEANVAYYKKNIAYLRSSFIALGYEVYGGENAPYLWVKIKNNLTSWELFDLFLNKLEVVVVPGAIFGKKGDQYFRVSALGKYENAVVAMERIKQYEQQIKEN